MLEIEKIDTKNKRQVHDYVRFPYRLYKDCPQWVPPLYSDVELQLDSEKHPFYEHSKADFFLAYQDREVVGRIAALEHRPYNKYHDKKLAQFYHFETMQDIEIAEALFNRVFDWAKENSLTHVMGPKGFAVLDGYGLLIEGFEYHQIMTMMNYNYPYYVNYVETFGFNKEVDFVSCYLSRKDFNLPERIHSIAERVKKRGTLRVLRFENKKELKSWAQRIGKAYNAAFINNWEYAPLSEREIDFILSTILDVADPQLIKVIAHKDEAVGFLLGFPDLSEGLQKAKGKLFPFGIFHLLSSMKNTSWIAVNGAGVLPEFQGRGGNALLYSELEKTVKEDKYKFKHCDMTQIAETAVQMRRDLTNLGGKPYKNHRVYIKSL
jgi:GNAT superfamily N-acetyltransferase